jgi:hypothetical protein
VGCLIDEVAPDDRHVLLPEGGCCLECPEGCRVVLAVGLEAGASGLRRHGVALRQETLACGRRF